MHVPGVPVMVAVTVASLLSNSTGQGTVYVVSAFWVALSLATWSLCNACTARLLVDQTS